MKWNIKKMQNVRREKNEVEKEMKNESDDDDSDNGDVYMGDSTKIVQKAWLICRLCVFCTRSLANTSFSCFLSVFYIFQLTCLIFILSFNNTVS